MTLDLIVVDDFYENPDRVRNFAIQSQDYLARGKRYESQKLYYSDDLIMQFEKLLGITLHVDPKLHGFGTLNYCTAEDDLHHYTHYDDTEWTGLIYLTPNELVGDRGLSICRHKPTDLMGPPDEEWLQQNGFDSFEEWFQKVYVPSKTELSEWETIMFIPMRFNRLVLKRGGRMFHRASEGFGKDASDSRLMQRFFFEQKR